MLKAIVCVDRNWAIGKKNGLLFNIKRDMEWFKENTLNKTVVVGYNTLLSFPNGKPLKNRNTIVLCPEGIEPEGCKVFHVFDEMLSYVLRLSMSEDVFVIGGGMLYNSMDHYCEEVLVTKVDAIDKEATIFYPNLDKLGTKRCIWESKQLCENDLVFRFCVYKSFTSNCPNIKDFALYEQQLYRE